MDGTVQIEGRSFAPWAGFGRVKTGTKSFSRGYATSAQTGISGDGSGMRHAHLIVDPSRRVTRAPSAREFLTSAHSRRDQVFLGRVCCGERMRSKASSQEGSTSIDRRVAERVVSGCPQERSLGSRSIVIREEKKE